MTFVRFLEYMFSNEKLWQENSKYRVLKEKGQIFEKKGFVKM